MRRRKTRGSQVVFNRGMAAGRLRDTRTITFSIGEDVKETAEKLAIFGIDMESAGFEYCFAKRPGFDAFNKIEVYGAHGAIIRDAILKFLQSPEGIRDVRRQIGKAERIALK